jgi:DNA-binding NarL/FixJ family response regulator
MPKIAPMRKSNELLKEVSNKTGVLVPLASRRGTRKIPRVLCASTLAQTCEQWMRELHKRMWAPLSATTRIEVEEYLKQRRPAVLVLDLSLLRPRGGKGIAALQALSPRTKILVLTKSLSSTEAVSILTAGARGYYSSDISPTLLLRAVEVIHKGEIWLERKFVPLLLEEVTALARRLQQGVTSTKGNDLSELTSRQQEIARLLTSGVSNKEIASLLSITERTVKAHITEIFRRLGVSDRVRLAMMVVGSVSQ